MYTYIYIYIYIYVGEHKIPERELKWALCTVVQRSFTVLGKGDKMGSALMGSHCRFHVFCDRGTFWVLPLTYFYLRTYLFSQVKVHYFCSGPISADPVCPQPRSSRRSRASSAS